MYNYYHGFRYLNSKAVVSNYYPATIYYYRYWPYSYQIPMRSTVILFDCFYLLMALSFFGVPGVLTNYSNLGYFSILYKNCDSGFFDIHMNCGIGFFGYLYTN